MAYNDGKAPTFKRKNPFVNNQGGQDDSIMPGDQSTVASRPQQPLPSVERPTARGGGLFKAKYCIPGKGGM